MKKSCIVGSLFCVSTSCISRASGPPSGFLERVEEVEIQIMERQSSGMIMRPIGIFLIQFVLSERSRARLCFSNVIIRFVGEGISLGHLGVGAHDE